MSHHRFEDSTPSLHENLALFELPPTSMGVERVHWVEYRPISQTDEGPIEFAVSGAGHQYVDLKNTRLFIKAKIVKPDGSSLPHHVKAPGPGHALNVDSVNPEAFVTPVNLWLHSLFNQVDLMMQQKVVNTSNVYPYRSFIETLIYPYDPRQGQSELFFKDTVQYIESTKPFVEGNEGLKERWCKTTNSQECDMEGPLHLDLCQQSRYIMNGVDFGLRLWPSKNSFRLMSDIGECTVKITEAILKVCKIQVSPTVLATHNSVMQHVMTAKYPYERTEMKTFTVMTGLYSFNVEDVFQGEVPNKVVFGLVTASAYNGDLTKNPFHFKHCDINEVGIMVDDVPVPQKPLNVNFNQRDSNGVNAFIALFEEHPDLDMSRTDFEYGFTLFSFTTRRASHESMNTLQKGNCSIQMKFTQPIEETMTLVVMAKFPHVMEIDLDRQIL